MNGFTLTADILSWVSKIIGILLLYKTAYVIIGFFTTRKFAPTSNTHNYAFLIAARNESRVIAQLIESIKAQDYPADKMTVFVVADNCTDNTAQIARDSGAVCYERFDSEHRTKGYALQFLVKRIKDDYGIKTFDAYFIFDADNILKRDFVSRMNEAFDSGERIITSYRNTKNFDDNIIAASYALHWLRSVRTEHRARSVLRLATRLQGTGYMFASELIEDGWNYTSLTEDRYFSADAVVKGYRIAYNDAAEFYDEQPTSLKIAFRQRMRWAKGHLQVFAALGAKLFKGIFTLNFPIMYDMFWIVVPENLFSFIRRFSILLLGAAAVVYSGKPASEELPLFHDYTIAFLTNWLGVAAMAIYVFIMENRHVKRMPVWKKALYCVTFPIFDLIGLITICISVFKKVEWKPIPHTIGATINDMEADFDKHK